MSFFKKFVFVLALIPALTWATPININTADAETLASLSGFGPSKASAIIAYRNAHGPFSSISDLVAVKGIGTKTVEKLREQLTVDKR